MGRKNSKSSKLKDKLKQELFQPSPALAPPPVSAPRTAPTPALKPSNVKIKGTGSSTSFCLSETTEMQRSLQTDKDINKVLEDFKNKQDRSNCPTHPELFEKEDQSDVTFLVGANCWRFPGHKLVLAPASPVFYAMLHGPLSSMSTKEIPIEDVEPRAFENILRFIYMGDVKLPNIESTLDTLYATDKYMMSQLTQLCLEVLNSSLNVENVLHIHHGIRLYCSLWSSHHEMDDKIENREIIALLHTLQNRCLEIIDKNAEQVLESEDFENLSIDEVRSIVFRDTLQVKDEGSVFWALHRWANQQCKCNQKELTCTNKRDFLSDTLYAARYLLMTKDQFIKGPRSIELLTTSEKDWLLQAINGKTESQLKPPIELESQKEYFGRRRGHPLKMIAGDKTLSETLTTKQFVDPWISGSKSKNKKCCRVSDMLTECFVCISLFFD